MVKIVRTTIAPVIKYLVGVNVGQSKCDIKRQDLCNLYLANPLTYVSGATRFFFDEGLLREDIFLAVFKSSQNNKCCYCQKDLDPGIVEHFRPKGKFKQARAGREYFPGYYWLAYEWSNLLYACGGCNTSYKGNLFPIYNIAKRAKNHTQNYLLEDPILINPLREEPSTFIYFNKEKIKHRGTRKKGYRTIKILGLDRTELNNERREYLNDIQKYKEALALAKGTVNENTARILWRKYLSNKKRKYNKFSAMVNDNFKSTYL